MSGVRFKVLAIWGFGASVSEFGFQFGISRCKILGLTYGCRIKVQAARGWRRPSCCEADLLAEFVLLMRPPGFVNPVTTAAESVLDGIVPGTSGEKQNQD